MIGLRNNMMVSFNIESAIKAGPEITRAFSDVVKPNEIIIKLLTETYGRQ